MIAGSTAPPYLQGDIIYDPTIYLPAPVKPCQYHVYFSKHNRGAAGIIAEVNEYLQERSEYSEYSEYSTSSCRSAVSIVNIASILNRSAR